MPADTHDAQPHPFSVPVDPARLATLTTREREVLRHLARGDSNRLLAKHLGITERTVRAHVTNVVRKLSVESRFKASLVAIQHHESLIDEVIAS